MRQDRIIQASIFDLFSEHQHWFASSRRVAGRASRGDRLGRRRAVPPGPQIPTGRDGLPAEYGVARGSSNTGS